MMHDLTDEDMLADDAALAALLFDWSPDSIDEMPSTANDALGALVADAAGPKEAPHDVRNPRRSLSRSSLCRQRQREELLRLRREVEELEAQYETLRRERRTQPGLTPETRERADPNIRDFVPTPWERIARHQRQLRVEKQTENVRLRSLLDEHRSQLQRIEKTIHHHALEERTRSALGETAAQAIRMNATDRWLATASSPRWQCIFHRMFQNDSFWAQDRELELLTFSCDARGRTIVEFAFSKVFPFDLSQTSDAIWRTYSTQFHTRNGDSFSVASASDALVVAEARLSVKMADDIARVFRSNVLVHKIHEHTNRAVFVWEDGSSPARQGRRSTDSDGLWVVDMTLDICVVAEQLVRSGDDHGSATLLRIYLVSAPIDSNEAPTDPLQATRCEFERRYLETGQHLIQMIETDLLNRALGLDVPACAV